MLSGIFWGIFLIFLGFCAILKTVLHINISIFRIGFALFIIYIGVSMLVNGPRFRVEENTVLFDTRKIVIDRKGEYNIIFGRGEIDLTSLPEQTGRRTEINVIFGEGVIKINPEIPMRIKVNSAFAGTKLPDGNRVVMGNTPTGRPIIPRGTRGWRSSPTWYSGIWSLPNKLGSPPNIDNGCHIW